MRIGLDLDGVVFSFLDECRKVFPSIPANPTKIDMSEYLSPQQKEVFKFFVTNPQVFRNLPLIPGMEELIPYFNSQETYVVSSRWKKVQDASMQRIYEVGLRPENVIFTSAKAKAVRDHKLDVLIEDQPKYAEPVKDAIVLMPYLSYNKEFLHTKAGPNVYYYDNPQQLQDYLTKIGGIRNGRRPKE